MKRDFRCSVVPLAFALGLLLPGSGSADPVKCQKTIASYLLKAGKAYLGAQAKCLRAENVGDVAGPCPDGLQPKIDVANQRAVDHISVYCSPTDLAALG